jgi:small-conductance mechanosensitive channel
MKKTKTKKTEPKTEPKPATPPEPKPNPAHDLAISRLSRIIDQAEHLAALHERDARIEELLDRLSEADERIEELREQIRSLGGVIASV